MLAGLLAVGAAALVPAPASAEALPAPATCVDADLSDSAADAVVGKLKRCKKAIQRAWKACKKKPFSTRCAQATAIAGVRCGSMIKGPWNFIVCLFDADSVWDYFKCLTGLDWFDGDDDDDGGGPN